MTNPFADISDPVVLRAMVQDGVKCERCKGRRQLARQVGMTNPFAKIDCPTCNGTGYIPLSNVDLDALAACWCEGIFVRNWIWKYPKHYTHYVSNPPQYVVQGNWVLPPAYTTSPDAVMRLRMKYNISTYRWHNRESWLANADDCNVGRVDENPCRAETEAALIAALTEAIKGVL